MYFESKESSLFDLSYSSVASDCLNDTLDNSVNYSVGIVGRCLNHFLKRNLGTSPSRENRYQSFFADKFSRKKNYLISKGDNLSRLIDNVPIRLDDHRF